MMDRIDLNCDMGEGFGVYALGCDEAIMPYVTSVNIACGFHAGDPGIMRQTVKLALEHGTAVGAHPGLPDRLGFGRRKMFITPEEAYDMVVYQIGALRGFVRALGGQMQHVKPHGALYNMAASDAGLAGAIARAVQQVDDELILFGLAGSELVKAGQKLGMRVAAEGFADRRYEADGTLSPRHLPDALIPSVDEAANQVKQMVRGGKVIARGGQTVHVNVDTICLHGDSPHAFSFARELRQMLESSGIVCMPVGTQGKEYNSGRR